MANKAKTLVILTPGFPENEADSTCVPPQQIFVKALKETAPDLTIIILTFQYPFFSKEYEWNGVRVISFGNLKDKKAARLFTGLRVRLILTKLNNNHHIIGLLSFWLGKCALAGNSFAKKHRIKHYCWLLGQDAKPGNKYVKKINPTGNSLIALSDFIVREFNKNYGVRPVHLIPVGVDTSLFPHDNVNRDIDILGAGSLIPLKQYAIFIEAVNELRIVFPNIKAVICGDGQEMNLLKIRINDCKLEKNISLTGRLKHSEVLAMMQRSKTFLHTSNYEGFGAVCLEALYAGAHVVSFVKPMDMMIKNWHIATDREDMIRILKKLLFDETRQLQPVLPYTIQDNAKAMLKLFNYNEAAIS